MSETFHTFHLFNTECIIQKTITILITPAELREVADSLEKRSVDILPGTKRPFVSLNSSSEFMVLLMSRQEELDKKAGSREEYDKLP